MHILFVDDQTLFREALLNVLQRLSQGVVVIEAASAKEAKRLAMHYQELDLILLDLALPDANGVSLILELQSLAPTVPVVVLSATEAALTVQQALESGAAGYIPKSSTSHEALAALRLVFSGDIYVPPKLLRSLDVLTSSSKSAHDDNESKETSAETVLSPRLLDVLRLMAQGLSNKIIARQMQLAEGTVKLHVASILRVLKVSNRTEAAMMGARFRADIGL